MEFKGIYPYLVSPVDGAGRVLEKELRQLCSHLIACGVHGLSPLGSTGEVAYLSFEQRCEIVRIVAAETGGRVPVVAGVAAYSTIDALRQADAFTDAGAQGLVLILQSMGPLGRPAMLKFFRQIAEKVSIPLVLYTNPGLYGVDLTPDVIQELSDLPAIQYVKDASGNTGRIQSILNRCGDRIKVFSASAHLPAVVFQLGGVGWMAGPACIIPRQCVALYDLCCTGRWQEAYQLQKAVWGINELFQKYALAPCIKAALNLQGFAVGDPISPQEPLPPAAVKEIETRLAQLTAAA